MVTKFRYSEGDAATYVGEKTSNPSPGEIEKKKLIKDLRDFKYIDIYLKFLVDGKTKYRPLSASVIIDGRGFRLIKGGVWHKQAKDFIKFAKGYPRDKFSMDRKKITVDCNIKKGELVVYIF